MRQFSVFSFQFSVLMLALTLTAPAQDRIPPRQRYNHSAEVVSKYDKFQNQTLVGHTRALISDDEQLRLLQFSTFFHFEGTAFKMPAVVTILFYSTSGGWRFLRNRWLIVLADGARIDLGETKRVEGKVSGRLVHETLSADMPVDKFLQIVNSKSVEMQLGVIEFKLSESALEAMRDVASRLKE